MNIKKFFYSLLTIIVIETLITIMVDSSWRETNVSPFDLLAGLIYPIINIPLAIILAYPEKTRTTAFAFLLSALVMPGVFTVLLSIHEYVNFNHFFSDAQVYTFNYEGNQYRLMLQGKELEEYLDKALSPEKKQENDIKNVFEIVQVEDENRRLSILTDGNYKKTAENEYTLVQNGFSNIGSARYTYACGVPDFDSSDTLEFKVRNDSLIGLFKSPIKLRRIQ